MPDRSRFRQALQREIDSQGALSDMGRGSLAVVMLDMDRFKHVTDALEYAFGDRSWVAVAHRLTRQDLRDIDMAARPDRVILHDATSREIALPAAALLTFSRAGARGSWGP